MWLGRELSLKVDSSEFDYAWHSHFTMEPMSLSENMLGCPESKDYCP